MNNYNQPLNQFQTNCVAYQTIGGTQVYSSTGVGQSSTLTSTVAGTNVGTLSNSVSSGGQSSIQSPSPGQLISPQNISSSNNQSTQSNQSSSSNLSSTSSSLAAMQAQFVAQNAHSHVNFVSFAHQPVTVNSTTISNYNQTINCLQKEVESLKKHNNELQSELEKLRTAYADCNYQVMTSNMKLNNFQEQFEQLHKEKIEHEKVYKELKVKYDEKFALFRSPHQSEERSLFCDECNFEVSN